MVCGEHFTSQAKKSENESTPKPTNFQRLPTPIPPKLTEAEKTRKNLRFVLARVHRDRRSCSFSFCQRTHECVCSVSVFYGLFRKIASLVVMFHVVARQGCAFWRQVCMRHSYCYCCAVCEFLLCCFPFFTFSCRHCQLNEKQCSRQLQCEVPCTATVASHNPAECLALPGCTALYSLNIGGGGGVRGGAGDISSTLPYTALPHGACPKGTSHNN